jgi:N utilization substance protein B|tara:strand:- start:29 stop:466 length:438 start_codon:yes stop_codon:yes gene_type:complete
MSSGSRHLARRSAVQALYQWELTGQSAAEIEPGFISDDAYSGVNRDYFLQLIENIPGNCASLDECLGPCLSRELDSLDPVERSILRLATYELLHEPKIPHKVVLNEAVELCRIFGSEEGYRFVNGVLDCLSKQIQQGKESRLPAC